MSQIKIAVLDDYQNIALEYADWSLVKDKAHVTVFQDHISNADALMDRLHPFDVVCVMRERTPLTRQIINGLPHLKLIVSTGRRNASIDLNAAEEAGIVVKHTRYVWTGAPELTWALLMAIAKNIPQEYNNVRNEKWQSTVGEDLAGKTLGIIGLGNIGSKMATFAKAFDMNVIAWSQNLTEEKAVSQGVTYVTKERLFSETDFITVHLVLSERTKNIVSLSDFRRMKKTAYFINTSRGPLVNEADLIKTLESRSIAGAALDVFDIEPLPPNHPFRQLDNVLATGHIGYGTHLSYKAFFEDTVKEILEWIKA